MSTVLKSRVRACRRSPRLAPFSTRAKERHVPLPGTTPDCIDETRETLRRHRIRDGHFDRHARGGGPVPRGELERVGVVEPHLPDDVERVLEVGVRFAWETNNDVGGERE